MDKPVEDISEFDAKEVEANLKAQEKENLKNMDDKGEDGQKRYAGGPIPR